MSAAPPSPSSLGSTVPSKASRSLNREDGSLTPDLVQPVAKRLAAATGAVNYNILQNNGRLAHQVVDHVHFHMVGVFLLA